MPQNNLSEMLQEVRASYRLLYNFQKRVLDLVHYIGGKYGFSYSGGYPKYSNPAPKRGKGHLSNWAWDWLNMYYYEFGFIPKDKLHFSIFLLADSGYYEVRENSVGKLDTANFLNVKSSKSELIFVVGYGTWESCWGEKMSWDKNEFILENSGEYKSEKGVMFHKHYNLEAFETEDDAISMIKDFAKECHDKNIPLSIINQAIK